MFEEFNLKNRDKKYLAVLTIFSAVLIGYYINFNMDLGTYCSDVYLYLLNALYFTGTNIHYPENIYLSPVICFLTSLLFRLGFVDRIAIFIVTGILAIIGNIGLYLLLRRYFSDTLSLTGAVIYATFTLNLTWLANGSLDVPAVSSTIWIALIGLIAIKNNPKYYRYLFLVMTIGFYTRYTTMLVVPALALYYVYINGFTIKKEERKDIAVGIVLGLILFSIITSVIYAMSNGNMLLIGQIADKSTDTTGNITDPAYNTDALYYLTNMPNFISNSNTTFGANPDLNSPTLLSWAIILMLAITSIFWLKGTEIKLEKKKIIPIVLFIAAFLSFKHTSSLITIIFVLLGLYILGKDSDNKTGYMMLAWILTNFIFFSALDIKVNRYIIPITPALTYFIIKAVNIINDNVKINKNIIPIVLIALFVIQGFAFTYSFEDTQEYSSLEDISNYIIDHDSNYKNVKIGAYNMRPYLWYLGYNVTGIEASNTEAIDGSNVTYYISNMPLDNLNNYSEIKIIDKLHLYKNNIAIF